jgi:uncharacterized protein (DUF2164 family)
MKRKHDLLTQEQRRNLNNEIIDFFKKENDVEVGILFADELIDLFLKTSAEDIYNKGVEESKKIIQEKLSYLEIDLDSIKK